MPQKFEVLKLKIPRKHDRRVKLSDDDKAMILRNEEGLSIRGLARKFNVSKRTIQFIVNPSALKAMLEARKKRIADLGGNKEFYARYDHNAYMRTHRAHKKELYQKNLLEKA